MLSFVLAVSPDFPYVSLGRKTKLCQLFVDALEHGKDLGLHFVTLFLQQVLELHAPIVRLFLGTKNLLSASSSF